MDDAHKLEITKIGRAVREAREQRGGSPSKPSWHRPRRAVQGCPVMFTLGRQWYGPDPGGRDADRPRGWGRW